MTSPALLTGVPRCAPRSVPSLLKLALQSNRLTSMAGLQGCTALQELYLSHNGIEAIQVQPKPQALSDPKT